jgi:hypothetical protein
MGKARPVMHLWGGGMKLDNELEGNNKRECHIPEAWAPKESR